MCIIFSLHPFVREYLVYCSVVPHTHTQPHPLGPSVHHSLISKAKEEPSLSASHSGTALLQSWDAFKGERASCTSWLSVPAAPFLTARHMLPASVHPRIPPSTKSQWHLLVLICEAYTVIHLRCYGYGGRFMTQNKLLRSCMWWGNQERKWAGNSLLHATLIHPSVRETSPLCAPHRKGP